LATLCYECKRNLPDNVGQTMENPIVTLLFLGFALGIAHACDPDHLVAVGTLTAEARDARQASVLGLMWGVGHTIALVLIGTLVLNMKWTVPDQFSFLMEAIVGLIIIIFGVRLLWRSLKKITIHAHQHSHDGSIHAHVHIHGSDTKTHHHHGGESWTKIFGIGMVHGLAGSAALSLAVISTMPSETLGVIYMAVFGIGSIGGMLVMSTLLSLPFLCVTHAWQNQVKCGAGLLAIGFGTYFIWSLLS
jgi:ABC-type nickel/cobalt efflux system permease component RcnA